MSTIGTFLVNTDDIGEAEAGIGANFGRITIGAVSDGSPTKLRVWRTGIGKLTMDAAEWTYSMSFDMEPIDSIIMCRVRSGTALERRRGGDMSVTGPDQMLAYGATEGQPFAGAIHAATYDLILIDRRALSAVAGHPKRGAHPISSTPVSPTANRMMVDAFDYVRHGVMANAHASDDSLLAGALTNYLATAVVSAFPVDVPVSQPLSAVLNNAEVLVRRATAFIDENAHTEITPVDIAAAANLTPQVLQMMFARQQGCTPMQYVRRVRLNHAHRDLMAADPTVTSVADIASRWGFGSVRRFAISYRVAYGQTPNATLRTGSARAEH